MSGAQARTAAFGLVGALVVFVATQRLSEPRYDFTIGADSRIAFVPASWFVYVLFYPYVVAAAALARPGRFAAAEVAAVIAFVVALVCFLALPELVPRPEAGSIENAFLRQRLDRMWQIDRPTHGFPSLHVAFTLLAAWLVRDRPWGGAFVALGLVICLSTLTVKQHTCVDVAGGALLAFASIAAAKRIRPEAAR